MARNIDPAEAANWSDEEFEANCKYLFARGGDEPGTAAHTLLERIKAARAGEAPTEDEEPSDTPQTVEEVKEWVGEDADRALEAYENEKAKGDDARKTLIEWLEGNFEFD